MEPPAAPLAPPNKWNRWNVLIDQATDAPKERTLARRLAVPAAAALACLIALLLISPPYVCVGKNNTTLSMPRLLTWGALGGVIAALMAWYGVLVSFCKNST